MESYVETNCTFTHDGRAFTAGGAVVTDNYVIGYVGESDGTPKGFILNDWHGNKIGTCRITSTWFTPRSYASNTLHQFYLYVNGNVYTGRGAGKGMIVKGRRVARDRS